VQEVGVQRLHRRLQLRRCIHHRLDRDSLVVERLVGAREVMRDELADVAAVVAVGDLLEGREVAQHLVEPSAQALAVLADETGQARGGEDRAHEE